MVTDIDTHLSEPYTLWTALRGRRDRRNLFYLLQRPMQVVGVGAGIGDNTDKFQWQQSGHCLLTGVNGLEA